MEDIGKEIIKSIQIMIEKEMNSYKVDRTYKSIVKAITSDGYVVLDNTGNERTVTCCIPGVILHIGQVVWVKEPMGHLNGIHICGVV